MHIEEVVIEGFKSYATRTVISGWDPSFNAITGLNGTGKSNILDAICFVLGIDNLKQVRASNLQDLIYKRGQAGVTRASVTIIFSNEDPSQSPIGYKDSPRLTVSRQIAIGGKNKYLINGHNAQKMAIENLFQSVQLNVNNPHFLIMQGQITRILNMRPFDTLALVEEAAGTRMFEDRKERAINTLSKKEGKVSEIDILIQETIHPKLLKLKSDRTNFLEWKNKEQELERLLRTLRISQYLLIQEEIRNHSETISSSLREQKEMETRKNERTNELLRLKEELQELQSSDAMEKDDQQTLLHLKKDFKECSKKLEIEETKMSLQVSSLSEMENRLRELEILDEDVEAKINNLKITFINPLKEKVLLIDESDSIKRGELEKDRSLLASLQTGTNSTNTNNTITTTSLTGYAGLLKEAREARREAQEEHSLLLKREEELRLPSLMLSSEGGQEIIAKAYEDHLELISLDEKKLSISKERLLFLNSSKSFNENLTEIPLLRQKLGIAKNQEDSLRSSLRWALGNYSASIKGVYGTIASLLHFKEDLLPEFSTALETSLGPKISNIVVEDEGVARQLLDSSSSSSSSSHSSNSQRLTIIPLNRIKSSTKIITPEMLKEAERLSPGNCISAISLLNLSKIPNNLMDAIKFALEGVMLCRTKEAASIVAFNPKISLRAITLEGDVYEPWGTLSGGSKSSGGRGDTLERCQKYHILKEERLRIEERLEDLLKKEDLLRISKKEILELEREILLIGQKISQQNRSFDESPEGKAFRNGLKIEEEIRLLPEEIKKSSLLILELETKCKRLEEENKEWMGDRDGVLTRLKERISISENSLSSSKGMAKNSPRRDLEVKEGELKDLNMKSSLFKSEKELLSMEKIPEIRLIISNEQEILMDFVEEKELKRRSVEQLSSKINEILAASATLTNAIRLLSLSLEEGDIEIDSFTQRLSSCRKQLALRKQEMSSLEAANPFLLKIGGFEDDYDEIPKNVSSSGIEAAIDDCLLHLKKGKRAINGRVMEMIEGIEEKEIQLQEMLKMVRKDRSMIEGTIDELDHYMLDSLQDTWKKVDADFDSILSELLPGANGKLVISGDGDGDGDLVPGDKEALARLLVERGLEIRVSLGDGGSTGKNSSKRSDVKFKSGLAELSGGQRSLVALALILSLLQFKPAPLYILDEVDAALDLHHTEAIGRILRSDRFGGAQFIVVSLKEGMFECANCLFRTKFHDGISGVERITSSSMNVKQNTNNTKGSSSSSLSLFNKATENRISSSKKVY